MAVRVHEEALCNITVALWMLCFFFVLENIYSYTTSYIVYVPA
jgi:hypothetical protein